MGQHEFRYKKWFVKYTPDDGARLTKISFDRFDLVTTEPESFKAPIDDYGLYETRPVYGYDDCFPSVEACTYPGKDWIIPDHGELCWLSWQFKQKADRLSFSVQSQNLPVVFKRELQFTEDALTWNFEVLNSGKSDVLFQHVIHPLMPLNKVKKFNLPHFDSVYDAMNKKTLDLHTPSEVESFLLDKKPGTANMLFVRNVSGNEVELWLKENLKIKIIFPKEHFNTIGIWWNNSGYPDEEGCRRNECAFEPVTGLSSNLSAEYKRGEYLSVTPRKSFKWQIIWKMFQLKTG